MTPDEFLAEWNNSSDRLLVHTSGSTGRPKPLWVEKRRMRHSALTTCRFLGLQPGDTALLCLPLDYIAGKMMMVRAIAGRLNLIAVLPDGHPLRNVSAPIAFAAMVPMQVYNSLQVPQERERLRRIKHLIIGGGAIDAELEKELQTFPNAVWSTYGMTETLSHIALRRISGPGADSWYTPLEGVTVCTDADGCLLIHAPALCSRPLVTNDIARLLETPPGTPCRFRILGRKDNIICSGGIKIQIEAIEARLRPHLPVPYLITKRCDAKFGEAVVILIQDAHIESARTICRRVLPAYWQPRHYVSVAQLPFTPTGKPDRAAAERLARQ